MRGPTGESRAGAAGIAACCAVACLALALLAAASGSAPARSLATASSPSGSEAIVNLNRQRKANGLPPVRHSAALDRGCHLHNKWMAARGTLAHDEPDDDPLRTEDGDRAGKTSVLGFGLERWSSWSANPWEAAPIQNAQLLAPQLARSGYDYFRRYSCANTLLAPRRAEPARLRLYTYPGPGTSIYRGERASESPYTPGELVGIPEGGLTGPYIIVLIDGPARDQLRTAKIVFASLRRLGGARVALKMVSSSHPELRYYAPAGGFVIPRHRLAANAEFVAKVAVRTGGGNTVRRTWRFETTARVIG